MKALLVAAAVAALTVAPAPQARPCPWVQFPSGHMQFNPCARIDTSQVQYRFACFRTPGGRHAC